MTFSFFKLAWLNFLAVTISLAIAHSSRAELQPSFDMSYCCEKATRIVVGTLEEGDRLTIKQVLSSIRMGMATIDLKRGPYIDKLRSSMGEDGDVEVVAFLDEQHQPVLGIAGVIGLGKDGVYLVHENAGFIGLRARSLPSKYPNVDVKAILAATTRAITLTKERRKIAKLPRSAKRATMFLEFPADQSKAAKISKLPSMWPDHHLRQVASVLSPIQADEEQIVLAALRRAKTESDLVRLLKLVGEVPCSDAAFEDAAKLMAIQQTNAVRSAAIRAIARINSDRAVDKIMPFLSLDDPTIESLIYGLLTDNSKHSHKSLEVVDKLEELTKELLARFRRGDGSSNKASNALLSALNSYLHPRLLPLIIDWAKSDHPLASQAISNLRGKTGLEFNRENLAPLNDWWKVARTKLDQIYVSSEVHGVDQVLRDFESADATTKKMLNRLWLFEDSIPEKHLLKFATSGTKAAVAKTTLAELWQSGQLSAEGKKSITLSFMKFRFVELDQPRIASGSRELRIIAARDFPFPKDAWIQYDAEFGIGREPKKPGASWSGKSIGGEGDIVLGTLGGGRYLGEPIAKAILMIRQYDHAHNDATWSHKWESPALKLKNSNR